MRISVLLPILLAALTAACARSEAPAAETAATTVADTAGVINPFARCTGEQWRACAAEVERAELAKSGGRVARAGSRLVFRTDDGRTTELVSDTSDSGRHERFTYGGYLPSIRHHMAMVQYYEGGSVVLVHAGTGATAYLYGWPAISPDGARVAAASVDLEAGHDENGIQLWRATDTHLALEWTLDGGERWGASAPAWHGAQEVRFSRETMPSPSAHPDEVVRTPMRIVLRGDGFALEPPRR